KVNAVCKRLLATQQYIVGQNINNDITSAGVALRLAVIHRSDSLEFVGTDIAAIARASQDAAQVRLPAYGRAIVGRNQIIGRSITSINERRRRRQTRDQGQMADNELLYTVLAVIVC